MNLEKRCRDLRAQSSGIFSRSLSLVKERGGPMAEWSVDLGACVARYGLKEVQFYFTSSHTVEPNTYAWNGSDIFTEEDCQLIEDAYWHIDVAVKAMAAKTSEQD